MGMTKKVNNKKRNIVPICTISRMGMTKKVNNKKCYIVPICTISRMGMTKKVNNKKRNIVPICTISRNGNDQKSEQQKENPVFGGYRVLARVFFFFLPLCQIENDSKKKRSKLLFVLNFYLFFFF